MPNTTDAAPVYEPPPPYRPPGRRLRTARFAGALVRRARRRPQWQLGAAAALGIAAIVIALFRGGGSTSVARSPDDAVRQLLAAAQHDDTSAADRLLCAGDHKLGAVSHLPQAGTVTAYSIDRDTPSGALTIVQASFRTTTSSAAVTQTFPVVRQGSTWRVCFTAALAAAGPTGPPTATGATTTRSAQVSAGANLSGVPSFSLPPPSGSGAHLALPTLTGGGDGLCAAATSGFGIASTYVGAAEIGEPDVAQGCVYRASVSPSVADSLANRLWTPLTSDPSATVIEFESSDKAARIVVRTALEPDGHWYVTAVGTA